MTLCLKKVVSNYINLLLIIISIVILLLTTILIDIIIGFFINNDGIIFPPNSITSYETPEYKYTAKINKLGFRDREIDVSMKAKKRIMIIGDSFTYGWGVNIEQSWPKILESNLIASGFDLEIYNLGQPGDDPVDYANIAEKAIPILNPDVVVIAVLEGDDLAQLAELVKLDNQTFKQKIKNVINYLYSNILRIIKTNIINQNQIKQEWKKCAIAIARSFNSEQMDRFNRLSDYVRFLFYNGDLNPQLINIAIKCPTYFVDNFDINNHDVNSLINKMANCFDEIKYISNKYHANVIIVAVPYGIYVSKNSYAAHEKIGFMLNKTMLTSNSADEAIKNASKIAGIDFLTVTDEIRERCKHSRLYFDLDNHFNANGYKDYADILTPMFITYLEKSFPKEGNR
jgi:lysophospholipase L1-like esterase